MKRHQRPAAIVLSTLAAAVGCCIAATYEPRGPSEAHALEMALYDKLPAYVCGVWPSTERQRNALPATEIPSRHIAATAQWLDEMLRDNIKPLALGAGGNRYAQDQWIGIKNLRWNHNYILGRFSGPPDGNAITIEIQATDRSIGLCAVSTQLFGKAGDEYTDQDVGNAMMRLLAIPSENIKELTVEKHTFTLLNGKDTVCYGKVRCGFNETSGPYDKQEWWSYLPFWVTKGRMFVDITTIKSGRGAASRPVDTWEFPDVK